MKKRLLFFLGFYLIGCVIFLLPFPFSIISSQIMRLELTSLSWRLEQRGPYPPSDKIVFVAIDDSSVKALGRWPWPRTVHCDLIRRLRQAKSAVVVFDVIFAEPAGIDEDKAFIECVKEAGNVVLAVEIDPYGNGLRHLIPGLAASAAGIGHSAPLVDSDGVVRRVPLIFDFNDDTYGTLVPSLSLAAVRKFQPDKFFGTGLLTNDILDRSGIVTIELLDSQKLKDKLKMRSLLVNFCGGNEVFQQISYIDILNGKITLEQFAGKIVLIGSVRDIGDFIKTPFARGKTLKEQMPGVKLHANAINTMLLEKYISRPPQTIFRLVLLSVVLILTLLLERIGINRGIWVSFEILALYEITAFYIFKMRLIWLEMVLPIGLVLFITGASLLYESRGIRRLLYRFVPSSLAEELLIERVVTQEREVEATIVFVDIRGYTSLAEQYSPKDILALLNECYSKVAPVIKQEKGIICDCQGDALMIFFSSAKITPTPVDNHALAGLKVALAIQEAIGQLNRKWKIEGHPIIELGCGISSGLVTWGWFKSGERLQLAAVGDAPNTAARLQALSKELGYPVLLSESTAKLIPAGIKIDYVTDILLKGKSVKTKIYGLLNVNL